MSARLSVRNLQTGFVGNGGLRLAVDGLSIDVNAGETFALVGESGCGKSLTALSLLRLLPPGGQIVGGEVRLDGENLLALTEAQMRGVRGQRLAMIFQEPGTSLNPVLTIGTQIGEVLRRHRALTGPAARNEAVALLTAVGIADPARRIDEYPFQLSGGMKQRVMIAMALAGDPAVLLADEPTTALDVTIQAQILALLAELQARRGMAMLLITHDLGIVAQMAHRVGVMYAGQLVEEGRRDDFFKTPVHPYTQGLFAALPGVVQRGQPLAAIAGQVPVLGAMPTGCRFAPRCLHAWERCAHEAPAWSEVADGHRVRCHLLAEPQRRQPVVPAHSPAPASGRDAGIPALDVQDLCVHFPIRKGVFKRTVGHVKAVDGVTLRVRRGRTLALVGESGCGKTTVGKAILQLQPPTGGRVLFGGQPVDRRLPDTLRALRRKVQMVFQDPYASLNPKRSVGEILLEGVEALGVGAAAERPGMVAALLREVGLPDNAAQRYPHEFSGGQRQRIAIARALAVQPDVIVCDEPTSALDVSVQAQILNLLRRLQAELGVAYLFITHNFAVVDYLADDVAVMYLGRIVEQGSADEVLRAPRHPYTVALLAAVPIPDPARRPDGGRLPGEAPSATNPPAGCHFHPRCPHAMDVCRSTYPAPQCLGGTHVVRCHLFGGGSDATVEER